MPDMLRPWSSSAARRRASFTAAGRRTFNTVSRSTVAFVTQAMRSSSPIFRAANRGTRAVELRPLGERPDDVRLEAQEPADADARQEPGFRLVVDPAPARPEVAGNVARVPQRFVIQRVR